MQLGAIQSQPQSQPIRAGEFDFTPLDSRVKQLEDQQKILMIALVLLAIYTFTKN